MYILASNMGKKMISIRFDTKLLEHVKGLKEVKKSGFTAYVENLCIKASKFKE